MALTLDEANKIVQTAIAQAKELNIKISVSVCDSSGRLGSIQPHGRGQLGRRLRLPGQGRRLGRLRQAQWCAGPNPHHRPGHRRRRGWTHDPQPGRSAHYPQRSRGGRVRRGRRHQPAGRRLRSGRRQLPLDPLALDQPDPVPLGVGQYRQGDDVRDLRGGHNGLGAQAFRLV